MKRLFYIIFLVVGPIILLIILFFIVNSTKTTNKPAFLFPTPTPYNATYSHFPNQPNQLPSPTKTAETSSKITPVNVTVIPSAGEENEKIVISGVPVNNFFISPVQTNQQGDILIIDDPKYQIAYLNQFGSFIISILGSPFDDARQKAESQFLNTLGISPQDACRLPVTLNTPSFANPDEAGTNYKLSFCQ